MSHSLRPRTRVLLLLLSIFLASPASAQKKVLRVGLTAAPVTLDPARALDAATGLVCAQVYETPYGVSPGTLTPEPRLLATPLRSDGAGLRSAPVRPGAVFSDGTPVTAAAVVASLSRVKGLVEKAALRAEGDRVVFALKGPDALLETFLSQPFCGVALEKGGTFLGSGPYLVAPGASLTAMVLVRNPKSPRQPAIDEIRYQVYRPTTDGSVSGLVNAVKRGDVDFTNFIPVHEAGELKDVPEVVTNVAPGKATGSLYFNVERPGPLQELAVRQAIAHAIDRAELARRFYGGDASFAAKGLLPAAMMGTNEGDGIAYDPGKARALLSKSRAAAAGPVSLDLLETWTARSYAPNPNGICRFIAEALGKVGFRVKVVPSGGAQGFFEKVDRGEVDMVLAGWIADTHEPIDFLEAQCASWSIATPGNRCGSCNNMSRWKSRVVDGAIHEYHEKRSPGAVQTILRLLKDEVPLFPLLYGPSVTVTSRRLTGFRPSPLSATPFASFDLTPR